MESFRRFGLFSLIACLACAGCGESDRPPVGTSKEFGEAKYKTPATEARSWPRWSGPKSDMISRETNWSTDWPNEGLHVRWKANVGIGFSSVSVFEKSLLTMGHADGNDTVYCLSTDTGKPVWTHTYPCALVDNLHEGGPGATPTIDESRVYTLSREGDLFCLDLMTGDVVWEKQISEDLEVEMPEWGFTCSPLVLGEKLIVEGGRTVAYNKLTGKKIWETEKYRPGYGSPVAFERNGETLLAVLNNNKVLVMRADDGREVASFAWTTQFVTSSSTPIIHDDTIFISTGYDKGCVLLRWKDDELEPVYENRNMRNHMNNSVLWHGYLYGVDGNSHTARACKVVCMNYETSEVAWSKRGFGCGSVLIANEHLLILSDDGKLILAKASPDGFEQLAEAELLQGKCWTVPVVIGGRVFCRNADGDLVCAELPAKAI